MSESVFLALLNYFSFYSHKNLILRKKLYTQTESVQIQQCIVACPLTPIKTKV